MRFKAIILFLLLGGVMSGCDRRVEARLDLAEVLMSEHPDSALLILESVDRDGLFTRRVVARHALLHSQALDKNYVDVDRDTLIRIATDYYRFYGTDHDRATALYYSGTVHDNAGRMIEAIVELKRAEHYASSTDDDYLKGLIVSSIGSMYLKTYYYDDAAVWYGIAVERFAAAGSIHNEAIATERLAEANYCLGRHDEALNLRRRAMDLYCQVGDDDSVGRLEHDILASRFAAGESADAIKREFLQLCLARYGARLTPESAGFWTNIYRGCNDLDSARICAEYRLAVSDIYSDYDIAGCYAQLSDIEKRSGNYRRAFDYLDRAESMADSLGRIADTNDIRETEKGFAAQRLGDEIEILAARNRLQKVSFLLVVVVVICLGVFVFFRYRQMRRHKANAEAELRTINETYRQLVVQHGIVKEQLDTRNEDERLLFEAIESRLAGLRSLMGSVHDMKPSAFVAEFRNRMAVNPRAENALNDLQYVVNRKYSGIIDLLKSLHPALSAKDLDLCALLCFGFSQTGICYIYGYSDIGTFYNKRSRLRKKMNLPEDYSIEDYIKNTIARLRDRELPEK